jgi:hypothetical protein
MHFLFPKLIFVMAEITHYFMKVHIYRFLAIIGSLHVFQLFVLWGLLTVQTQRERIAQGKEDFYQDF